MSLIFLLLHEKQYRAIQTITHNMKEISCELKPIEKLNSHAKVDEEADIPKVRQNQHF